MPQFLSFPPCSFPRLLLFSRRFPLNNEFLFRGEPPPSITRRAAAPSPELTLGAGERKPPAANETNWLGNYCCLTVSSGCPGGSGLLGALPLPNSALFGCFPPRAEHERARRSDFALKGQLNVSPGRLRVALRWDSNFPRAPVPLFRLLLGQCGVPGGCQPRCCTPKTLTLG